MSKTNPVIKANNKDLLKLLKIKSQTTKNKMIFILLQNPGKEFKKAN